VFPAGSVQQELVSEEYEFRLDRLPAKVQQQFSMGGASWRAAVGEAVGAGIRNPNVLADLIFFMQHPDRMTAGVGKASDKNNEEFFKIRLVPGRDYHQEPGRHRKPLKQCGRRCEGYLAPVETALASDGHAGNDRSSFLDDDEKLRINWDSTTHEPRKLRAGIGLSSAGATATILADELRLTELER
jgi:hypothetical protein